MRSRTSAVVRKEFIHIVRDPRSLMIIFIWPIIMMLLYGYAITFDIKEIKLGLLDDDRSPASRELVEKMTRSNYIHISALFSTRKEIEEAILGRKILAALIIPEKFGKKIKTQNQIELQVVVDGSNANSATVAINYIKSFFVSYSLEINKLLLTQPIQLHPRVWYNPDLKSAHFIVPGLVAVIMMMICALLTSVTITRERETGTLEQILVSPIKASEIVFGKFIPYVFLSIMDAVIIISFARLIFKVPFRGNPVLLLLLSIVYVYAAASLGVFISTRVKTQQVAMIAAPLSTMLPSFLLSGFIFPIHSMPVFLQTITYLVPARYFLVIIRGIMLKGIGITALYMNAIILLGFGTTLMLISVKRFKTNLED